MSWFTIPDPGTASNPAQAQIDSVDFDIINSGNGVRDGAIVSADGGSTLDVSCTAGSVKMGHIPIVVAAQTISLAANPTGFGRFDLVGVNNKGVLQSVAGTAALDPAFPALPANWVVLAAVYVQSAATDFDSGDVVSKRIPATREIAPSWTGANEFLGLTLPWPGAITTWAKLPYSDSGNQVSPRFGGHEYAVPGQTIVFTPQMQVRWDQGAANNISFTVAILDSTGAVIRYIHPDAILSGPNGWTVARDPDDAGTDQQGSVAQPAGSFPFVVDAGDLVDGQVKWEVRYRLTADDTVDLTGVAALLTLGSWFEAKVYDRIPAIRFCHDGQSLNNVPAVLDPGDPSTIGLNLRNTVRDDHGVNVDTRNVAWSGTTFAQRGYQGFDRHMALNTTYDTNVLFSWGSFSDADNLITGGEPITTPAERTALATTVVGLHTSWLDNNVQAIAGGWPVMYDYVIGLTYPWFGMHPEGSDLELYFSEYNTQLLANPGGRFDAVVDLRSTIDRATMVAAQPLDGLHHNNIGNDLIAAQIIPHLVSLGLIPAA